MVFSTMSEHCDAEDTRNIEGGAIFVSSSSEIGKPAWAQGSSPCSPTPRV